MSENTINTQQLAALLENVPGGIAVFSVGSAIRIESGNEGIYEMLGHPREKKGAPLPDAMRFVHPEDREHLSCAIRDAAAAQTAFSDKARLVKEDGTQFWARINGRTVREEGGAIRIFTLVTDISAEQRALEELTYRAEFDSLTGICNKDAFYARTAAMLKADRARKYVLLRWNIERFKVINDLFGTKVGDAVLKNLAQTLQRGIRGLGTYGRLEADHFAVCFPKEHLDTDHLTARTAGIFGGLDICQTTELDIGIYEIEDHDMPVDQMCDRANLALDTIKGNVMRHYAFYDDDLRRALLRDQLLRESAPAALTEKQFILYFQPIFSISRGAPVSAEALVRWKKPDGTLVSPASFIPLFEKNGFITKLDHYVWEEACRYLRSRRERGLVEFPLSVNVSRMSLYDPDLMRRIVEITEEYGVEPRLFKIEVTESAYNDNPQQLLATVRALRNAGFIVLMDDFGSGYSSLNTLKDMPVDVLKIDMKFMENLEDSDRAGSIVTSIVRMAKWLDMRVIAEGVETKEQVDFLRSIGCDLIQGFYFAEPMPRDQFEARDAALPHPVGASSLPNLRPQEFDLLFGGSSLFRRVLAGVLGAVGFYQFDGEHLELLRINDAYYDIVGEAPSDIRKSSENVLDSLPEDGRLAALDACREAVQTGRSVRRTVHRRSHDGRDLWLDCSFLHIGRGDSAPILCLCFSDISQQIASRSTIDRQNDYLTDLVAAVPCGICLFARDSLGQILSANLAAAQIFGFTRSEDFIRSFYNEPSHNIVREDLPRIREAMHTCAETGDSVPLEHRVRRQDGTIAILRCLYRPTRSVDGDPAVQAIFNDITEWRNAEESAVIGRYAELICSLYDDVCEVDFEENTAILRACRHRRERIGLTRDLRDLQENWLDEHVLPEDRARYEAFMAARSGEVRYRAHTARGVKEITSTLICISGSRYLLLNREHEDRAEE